MINWANFISQCFNGLVLGALLALVTGTGTALADSQSLNFEPPGSNLGSIDTQNG